MILTPITDRADERLRDYTQLTDVALRRLLEVEQGLYIAESLKVIARALAAGHVPRSVLLTEQWLPEIQPLLEPYPDVPVFLGTESQLESLTGFHMHRGAMAAMHRPPLRTVDTIIQDAHTVVILEDLTDHTNVGAIFRSAAALGADAVLVSERCADPLYRRSVRVSMGSVLQIPWTRIDNWDSSIATLRENGFEIAAFALDETAVPLAEFARDLVQHPRKVALLLGSEGDGLSKRGMNAATVRVTIPMHHGVDSLNVANAATIALWATIAS